MAQDLMNSGRFQQGSVDEVRMSASSPPQTRTTGRALSGHRLLAALTGLFDDNFSAPKPKSSGATSSSLHVGAGRVLSGIAILALLAVGTLFLLPVGPLMAQDSSTIKYAENGTGPAAVFTAVDPEIAGAVTWSLKDDDATDDDEDFEIDKSSGELSFKKSPNYEMATGGGSEGSSNTYTVTVVATDADRVASEKEVTVEVTNEEEAGKVTQDKVAPYPGVELTATLSDPDDVVSASDEWQWSRSMSQTGSYAEIEDAEAVAYTPTSGDVGYYLRATVSYKDGEGDGKSAMATSAHEVQAINSPNATPAFPDQDPDTAGCPEHGSD